LVVEKVKRKYRKSTLKNFVNTLRALDRQVDIDNPIGVYDYVSNNFKDNGKIITWQYYTIYARHKGYLLKD